MNPKTTFLFLLCIGTLLAGCTGDPAPKGNPFGDVQFSSTTGGIRGLILDENELPIPEARVEVVGGTQVGITGEDGIFAINFVPPGEHVLLASADGFQPVEISVAVAANELTDELMVTLTPLASAVPYVLTETARRTISGFTFKATPDCIYVGEFGNKQYPNPAWYSFNTTKTCTGSTLRCQGAPDPCSSWSFNSTLNNNTNWKTILIEGAWIPSSAATGRSFYVDLVAPGYRSGSVVFTDKEVWYAMTNTPPLIIRVDSPDTLVERGIAEENWCCNWRARLFPAQCDLGNCFERFGPDVGIMVDQTIDLYFSLAINEPLPGDYSARPIE